MDSANQVIFIVTNFIPAGSLGAKREMLMSPTVIVDLSTSPSSSINFCLMYFYDLLLSTSIEHFYPFLQNCYLLHYVIPPNIPDNCPFLNSVLFQYTNPCFLCINVSMVYFCISLLLTYQDLYI